MMKILLAALSCSMLVMQARAFASEHPASDPAGRGRSQPLARARVVIAEDRDAVATFSAVPDRVEELFNRGLFAFTGQANRAEAWRSLISTQDTVGIKVVSSPGAQSGTRPSVVAALVKGLLAAGLPPKQIVIWDKHLSDLQRAKFVELAEQLGVGVAGAAEEGYDSAVSYEMPLLGKLIWGDHDFGKNIEGAGRRSYVTRLMTRKFTKLINVTPLLNHNLAGVSGNLFTLALDSVDNALRFESSPEHLAQAVPEIYAMEAVGDKVVLSIVDGLICQYQGEERTLLHYSAMLGEIRFSADPLALDILSIREIQHQRAEAQAEMPRPLMRIYSNGALLELGVNQTNRIDVLRIR